jgi:hypothetical protein
MRATAIEPCDISAIEFAVFKNGTLLVMPFSYWNAVTPNERMYFMWKHGIYVLPTEELVSWLKAYTVGSSIEICAGIGSIGKSLAIPVTDSRMQEDPVIALRYKLGGQPTITYPEHVEKIDAHEAVMKYQPDTVIGAFVTHRFESGQSEGNMFGVQEEFILQNCKRYINIGNLVTHATKPILNIPHKEYHYEWLITRSVDQSKNTIFVFEGFKR